MDAHLTLICIILLFSGMSLAQEGGDRFSGLPFATRSPVLARHGMAATSHPLASQVAIDILKAGGSAVDAAIAANATLCLMEPTGNGIGGDLFAIVWDPKKRALSGLNASGRSPRGLDLAKMKKLLGERQLIPLFGPLPVSVPGAVSGWGALHERFGRLPLKSILAPAIRYARAGFPVTEVIAYYWGSNARRLAQSPDGIAEIENFKKTFMISGKAPKAGEIFRNPDLANTLETIGKDGTRTFYEGPIARTIAAYCERVGCYLRLEDLKTHRADWVDPVSTTYRGVTLHELPPNGQGIAALQMLNILEGFSLADLGHNSDAYLHLHVEAKKLAFADRARFYADPKFADIPLKGLLSKKYAAERRKLISKSKAMQSVDAGNPRLHQGDTIYLTVADKDGMMVSLIQSNYVGMGSGLVPDGLGFVLQDRGALFTLEEGHPNVYAPGKRPFHTIIPAFATKAGEPFLSFGVMGGSMQPQGHAQIICNIIDFGMNVQEAGDAARYNHGGSSQPTGTVMKRGGRLSIERGVPKSVLEKLEQRGHRTTRRGSYGGYQAILWDSKNRVYHGASEMRKDGQAIGY